jgi:hypothetical protein
MNTRIIAVPRDTTVDELLKNYFSAHEKLVPSGGL